MHSKLDEFTYTCVYMNCRIIKCHTHVSIHIKSTVASWIYDLWFKKARDIPSLSYSSWWSASFIKPKKKKQYFTITNNYHGSSTNFSHIFLFFFLSFYFNIKKEKLKEREKIKFKIIYKIKLQPHFEELFLISFTSR